VFYFARVGKQSKVSGGAKKVRLVVRGYNALSHALERLGRGRATFVESEQALHDAALRAATRDDLGKPTADTSAASDFGDSGYLEGLRVLLSALDKETEPTPFGRMMLRKQIVNVLCNRLLLEMQLARQPAIEQQPIEKPIIILGLPRTGTTALHQLMGNDPGIQVLEYWLAAAPQPRPLREQWGDTRGYKQALADLRGMYYLDPSLKAVHLMTADGAEECRHLLQHCFADDTFDCNSTIPAYSQWYDAVDMRPAYLQHRRCLQLIGSTAPGRRWVLKYPVHMGNLDLLFELYPDACVVQTHRDPARIVPSECSLVSGWRALYETGVDRHEIGRRRMELWARRLEHTMEVRKGREDRFFDLNFREVLSDPVAAVRRVYDHFGLELAGEGESRLGEWRQENPHGKYGLHTYKAADYGLDDVVMHDRYAAYMQAFGVELEESLPL
jgi:hypothetical protein